MNPELRHIIQWLQTKAPKAQDPRLALFSSIYKSSTVDPNSFKVIKLKNSETCKIKMRLSYLTPDPSALKRKKLNMVRKEKELLVTLEPKVDGKVQISQSRNMFALTLEEVLALWNLYLIFADSSKAKLFQQLIQEEN